MRNIKWTAFITLVVFINLVCMNACKPIKNLSARPVSWSGSASLAREAVQYDPAKKTVFVIADYKLTEMFDMMAPYYLFNATGKANVYIIAKDETPVFIKRDLFVKPQLTFAQADSMNMHADVIVIPALSIRTNQQDSTVVAWIKNHHTSDSKVLAICDGASTAAATGLYDGKAITCHASDYAGISSQFQRPLWTQNVSVTKSGNLFSTAGVSNAVEGSLAVIDEMFGTSTMEKVMNDIHYRFPQIKYEHKSVPVNGRAKMTALKKIMFRKNKDVGLLLSNGVNEFQLASVLDTYGRTFPATLTTIIRNDTAVKTKYGLSLIFTGKADVVKLDELHVLSQDALSPREESDYRKVEIVRYDSFSENYPIDVCLKRISQQYGRSFENLVKISLDYN